ncbi:MAG TPA: right-handed parallel beta-helix repeat-containing protein [Chthonomonadales bacterium]|nr:right-handed parallel beta-helix repeat-containing protein [Chthonomonadales bacterium]
MRPALIVALLACAAAPARAETTLHVSPLGDDSWSGRLARPNASRTDGPLASLAGARDALRALRAGGRASGPVTIALAAGEHRVTSPLVLEPRDGGAAGAPVVYRAAAGTRPVVTGGRRIVGWEPAGGGRWRARVPAGWRFEQLWVNSRRAVRARTPNRWYYYTTGRVDYGVDPLTGQDANLARRAFRGRPEDLAPLRALSQEDLRAAVVVAFHSWEVSVLPIAGIDGDAVVTVGPAPWPFLDWGPRQRYHLENLLPALDEPGEWMLDRQGVIWYVPRRGEDMRRAVVVAPVAEAFVRIEGTADRKVEHVRFEGIAFRHGQYLRPATGQADGQAAYTVPAAIMVDHGRHVSFRDCEIAHVGTYGIWFRRGCTDSSVVRSLLRDLGGGAVRIGEGVIRPEGPDRTRRIAMHNCIVQGYGQMHRGAVGVWIGQSGENRITHNDISGGFYTGVSVGWTWGYAESLAQRNTIEFNRIHNIGQGVLSDMGGVYTLGASGGSSVSHNHIHHVYSYDRYGRGGWGLYNDEGSADYLMEGNLVHHVKTGTYHQHYGRGNMIRNNILAYSMDGQLQRSRVEPHLSFTFERNIVLWDQGPLFTGSWADANVRLERNLYWAGGRPVTFEGRDLAAWQALGHDAGSIVADPLFVAPERGDFRLRPGSPASRIGFQPFDPSRAGVLGPASWRRLAASVTYPPVVFAPEPPPAPPMRVRLDFERVPPGAPCPEAQNNTEGRGDRIAVTEETAASGRRSLLIADAPDLQHAFNPHLVFQPNHARGESTCSFGMRVAADTVMYHEWRDWRTPLYRVGPSFQIDRGALTVGGREILRIPPDVWVRYTVRSTIGPARRSVWSLRVEIPGQPAREFADLPVGSRDFEQITWIGFSSNATIATSLYLDDLEIANRG